MKYPDWTLRPLWVVAVAVVLGVGALAVIGCATPEQATDEMTEEATAVAAEEELVEYLFVQHAQSVTLKDGILTLEGIGDDVLYFSDRPHRVVGRETVEWFVQAWDEGEESFAASPPNAVLTVKKEQELVDLTLVLTQPVLNDRTLVYTVHVLDGPESGSGELAALFIDTFVRQLRGRAKEGLKRDIGRGSGPRGRLRGGDPNLPRDPGGGRGRIGDPNLPRDPGGGRGGREVYRRGSRQGAEIR